MQVIDPPGVDFLSFWAAAHRPSLAYDLQAHRAIERMVADFPHPLPFPYPPTFLLVMLPFGLIPFPVAMATWLALGFAAYVLSTRKFVPLPYSFFHPALIPNALIGQTGLVTAALLFSAHILKSRPFLAGMLLGLLAIKPHLAALIPVALLAGREWKAIAGAACTTAALVTFATMAFGVEAWTAWLDLVKFQAGIDFQWNGLASVWALLRWAGVSPVFAGMAHAVVALAAASVTWKAWANNHKHKVAILAAATVLISPYLFSYDTVLLILPLTLLMPSRSGWAMWWCLMISILPHVELPAPNLTPIAALIALWALLRDHVSSQDVRFRSLAARP